MSWLICGTLPKEEFGLQEGQACWKDGTLSVGSATVPVCRGTSSLIAAATISCRVLDIPSPNVLLAGDCGKGKGSRALYAHLSQTLAKRSPVGVTFHYLLPDVDWQLRIMLAVESLPYKPLLVADAGYMYAAKMSGCASSFDLFTPDAGELAFLADEEAPHPFYTRGFLLADGQATEELILRASKTGGAAKALLVKGATDYIVIDDMVTDRIALPNVEVMEAIGGTGDTITGIVTALLYAKLPMRRALAATALTNRIMAEYAHPTPASQVSDLLPYLPQALEEALARTKNLSQHKYGS